MLKNDFSADYLSMIEHMSKYMESSRKMYKNHLATMELWKKADMENAKQKENGYSYNGNFEEDDSL